MKKKLLVTNVMLYIYLYHISLLFAAVYFGISYEAYDHNFLQAGAFTLAHFFYPPVFLILLILSVILLRNRESTEPRDYWIPVGIPPVLIGIMVPHTLLTAKYLSSQGMSWLRWAPISILVCTVAASIFYFLCAVLTRRENKQLEQRIRSRQ